MIRFVAALALAALVPFGTTSAAPGDMDPTFGTGGNVRLDFSYSKPIDLRAILLRDYMGIVVLGAVPRDDGLGTQPAVGRFTHSGGLDNSYGLSGPWQQLPATPQPCETVGGAYDPSWRLTVLCAAADQLHFFRGYPDGRDFLLSDSEFQLPSQWTPTYRALAHQPDGKLIVAGVETHYSDGSRRLLVKRYNTFGASPDVTFGVFGIATFTLPGSDVDVKSVVVAPDGSILVGGWIAGAGKDGLLVKVLPDGTLDSTFGDGGRVVVDHAGLDDILNGIAFDPSGRILVAGRAGVAFEAQDQGRFLAMRFLANGTPDASFNGGGRVLVELAFAGPNDSDAEAVEFVPAGYGDLFVVGSTRNVGTGDVNFAVARLSESGATIPWFGDCYPAPPCGYWHGPSATESDHAIGISVNAFGDFVILGKRGGTVGTDAIATSHNMGGYLTQTPTVVRVEGSPWVSVEGVALQPGGKILVLGSVGYPPVSTVRRLNADGSLDTSFGVGGVASVDTYGLGYGSLLTTPDGSIVGAGGGLGTWYFKLLADGAPDPAFIGGGLDAYNAMRSIAVQPDGKIVAAAAESSWNGGAYVDRIMLMRSNTDGTRDPAFGTSGLVALALPPGAVRQDAAQVLVQADGSILLSGTTWYSTTSPYHAAITVFRFLPSGAPDPSWGTGGVAHFDTGGFAGANDVAIASGGKVVVAGGCEETPDFCVVRFNADGTVDTTFGVAGLSKHNFGSHDRAFAVGVDASGRAVSAGSLDTGNAFAVRLAPDGQLDTTFNGTGVRFGVDTGYVQGAALQSDGKLVIASADRGYWSLARVEGGGAVDTTPPETSLVLTPANSPTPQASAVASFTANEPGSTFECRLDAAVFAACSSPVNLSSLSDGSHTFAVRAIDGAGNVDPTPATRTWTVDTVAPQTTIVTAPSGTVASGSATIGFSSNETGTFECRLDAGAFVACTSPASYAGLGEGSHQVEVRAIDAAGNADATPASATWSVDTTAPETTITSGPTGSTTQTTATIAFSSPEPGATFECRLDGAAFAACISPQSLSGLSSATHVFDVRARDAWGNADPTPASRTWTVDTTPPQTTIGSGPPAASNATGATFTFTASEAATFQCKLDGGAFSACTSPKAYSGLSQASHTFQVRATDALGQVDATAATWTWTVDTSAPNTTINSGPSGTTGSTSATFTFSSSQNPATFECQLDSGAYEACTSPKAYTGLPAGNRTFRVRARDAAGNVDASPATRGWRIN